jgi:parallel beta-helix repeat protein
MKSPILNTALIVSVLLFLPVVFADDTDSLQIREAPEYFAIKGLSSTDVGGLICTDTTWTLAGSPYIVSGSSIIVGCNATLTIEAGVVVKFNSTLGMIVGYSGFGNGTLIARGTEQLPIVFTSTKDPCDPCNPPLPGDWSRIYFTDLAVDAVLDANEYISGCILEYAIVEYAGNGNYAAVLVEKSSPFLNHCQIRHNSNSGIGINSSNAPYINITNCEVWDNSTRGIFIKNGSGHHLVNNNIHHNRNGGVYIGYCNGNTVNGNTVTDNSTTGGGGGGICIVDSGGNTLRWNDISENTSGWEGTGIYFSASSNTTFSGNAIAYNQISGTGTTGGVFITGNSQYVSLAGDPCDPCGPICNIVRDNDGYQIYNNNSFRSDGHNDVNAVYMNWGVCDIDEIQELIFDYFDNSAKAFVLFWPYICPGDFDMDFDVDQFDLITLVDNWLRQDCDIPDWCQGADIDVSTNVDFYDFAEFAENWLKER